MISRRTPRILGQKHSDKSIAGLVQKYLQSLRVRNYSEETLKSKKIYFEFFLRYCERKKIRNPIAVTRQELEDYQRFVFRHKKKNGSGLCPNSQVLYLRAAGLFFEYLAREGVIIFDPSSGLELPKVSKPLPCKILNSKEAEFVLAQPDIDTQLGVRDRAILEALYSTGIRRKELGNMTPGDIDRERGTIFIRKGKGNRDRVVPVGDRALLWLSKYQDNVRPILLNGNDTRQMFLTVHGKRMSLSTLTMLVYGYIKRANLGKVGACHMFRHSMATLMLDNGADVRYVQEMLGHSSLSTTEIYTRVSIERLKQVHAETHPTA